MKPLSALKSIKLSEMKVPMVHHGHYLICRVLTEAIVVVGSEVIIEDSAGHIEGRIAIDGQCQNKFEPKYFDKNVLKTLNLMKK